MFKTKLTALVLSLALACGASVPCAFADDGMPNDSVVSLQYVGTLSGDEGVATDDVFSVKVPATIPFAYRTDGSIVGPSADTWKIENDMLSSVYLDKNAILATGKQYLLSGVAGSARPRAVLALNGACKNPNPKMNMKIALGLHDAADNVVVATTHAPDTYGTLEPDYFAIGAKSSCGIDFAAEFEFLAEGEFAFDWFFSDIERWGNRDGLDIGTITWTFSQHA